MANSIGTAPDAPVPNLGDPFPTAQAAILAWMQEVVAEYLALKSGNANIDLGTDYELLHGVRPVRLSSAAGQLSAGAPTFSGGTNQYWLGAGASDEVTFALPLATNDRLNFVSVYGRANGTTAWRFGLYSVNLTTGVVTLVGSQVTSGTAAAIEKTSITNALATVNADIAYLVRVELLASGNRCLGVEFTFDKVATP